MAFERFEVVTCTVIKHVSYGLLVELTSGQRGWIERDAIREDRLTDPTTWPMPGTRLEAVLVEFVRDGRARLCSIPSYVEVVRRIHEPYLAIREWRAVR